MAASQRLEDQIGKMYVNNPRVADAFQSTPESRTFISPVFSSTSLKFPKIPYMNHILTSSGIVERT